MTATETHGESGKTAPRPELSGAMAFDTGQKKKLRALVKRGTDIEEKAKSLKGLKSALMDEVDDAGFDRGIVKRVIKARSTPKEDREFEQQQFEFYLGVIEEDD